MVLTQHQTELLDLDIRDEEIDHAESLFEFVSCGKGLSKGMYVLRPKMVMIATNAILCRSQLP